MMIIILAISWCVKKKEQQRIAKRGSNSIWMFSYCVSQHVRELNELNVLYHLISSGCFS